MCEFSDGDSYRITSTLGGIAAPASTVDGSTVEMKVESGFSPTIAGELESGPDSEIPDGIADAWQNKYGITIFVPLADSDHDGVCDLLEAAFNLNPTGADATKPFTQSIVEENGQRYLQMVYRHATIHPGLTLRAVCATSLDAAGWSADGVTELSRTALDDETEEVTVRVPLSGKPRQFLRLQATLTAP